MYAEKAALHRYKLFISHAWQYSDGYNRAVEFLHDAPRFIFSNYSVPQHNPIANTSQLKEEIRQQIRPVEVVLIVAGMYVNHSGWIEFEMDFADQLGKPMVGIKPWAAQRVPKQVQDRVDQMVGWNTQSIVSAIRSNR